MKIHNNLINFTPKQILLFFIILYFFFIFFFSFVLNIEYYHLWKLLGVPANNLPFSDIQPFFVNDNCKVISENLFDYYDQFKNCDQLSRSYNYMPVWLYILKFGISQDYYYYFGFFFIFIFYFSFFKLIKIQSNKDLALYTLIILSPPVNLSLERGNTDLLMFFLCFLFITLVTKKNLFLNLVGYFLLLFSSFIKFYPIFLVFISFRKNFYNSFFSLFALTIFIIYVFFNINEIFLIKEKTEESLFLSYGYNILEVSINNFLYNLKIIIIASQNYLFDTGITFKETISDIIHIDDFKKENFVISRLFSSIIILFSIIYFLVHRKKKEKVLKSRNYIFFIAGASIFCGTFLMAANFDYRLIFLLFTIPYLMEKKDSNEKFLNINKGYFIYILIFYLWISPLSVFTLGLDDIFSWLIFIFYINYLINYYFSLLLNRQ